MHPRSGRTNQFTDGPARPIVVAASLQGHWLHVVFCRIIHRDSNAPTTERHADQATPTKMVRICVLFYLPSAAGPFSEERSGMDLVVPAQDRIVAMSLASFSWNWVTVPCGLVLLALIWWETRKGRSAQESMQLIVLQAYPDRNIENTTLKFPLKLPMQPSNNFGEAVSVQHNQVDPSIGRLATDSTDNAQKCDARGRDRIKTCSKLQGRISSLLGWT